MTAPPRTFLKWLDENWLKYGTVAALLLFGWDSAMHWRDTVDKMNHEVEVSDANGKKVKALEEEVAKLRKYLAHNQEIELDQFNWICVQRKAVLNLNAKTCTYLDRQLERRFEYFDPAEPSAMTKAPTP